jgi:mRNA interferase MazF
VGVRRAAADDCETSCCVDLPAPTRSGRGFRRLVIVVQCEALNGSRLGTTVCVALTSNLKWGTDPANVSLPARLTGIPKDSAANVSQIVTVDKGLLTERTGKLPHPKLELLLSGISVVLGSQRDSTCPDRRTLAFWPRIHRSGKCVTRARTMPSVAHAISARVKNGSASIRLLGSA